MSLWHVWLVVKIAASIRISCKHCMQTDNEFYFWNNKTENIFQFLQENEMKEECNVISIIMLWLTIEKALTKIIIKNRTTTSLRNVRVKLFLKVSFNKFADRLREQVALKKEKKINNWRKGLGNNIQGSHVKS